MNVLFLFECGQYKFKLWTKSQSLYAYMVNVNDNILKRNCRTHIIIHNCVKFAIDNLDLDVENLILKVYVQFTGTRVGT
jgi:hypothetical protein